MSARSHTRTPFPFPFLRPALPRPSPPPPDSPMKFGRALRQALRDDHAAGAYIDYAALKKLVKSADGACVA